MVLVPLPLWRRAASSVQSPDLQHVIGGSGNAGTGRASVQHEENSQNSGHSQQDFRFHSTQTLAPENRFVTEIGAGKLITSAIV
jgi:hypothetical protein